MQNNQTGTIKKGRVHGYARSMRTIADFWSRYVVWIQAIYYLVMGLWPLLNIMTFQEVTGPKTDLWLVKTVGLLLIVVALVLILAAYRQRIHLEVAVLALGSALVLIMVELVYVFIGTISPIYLLDTLFEALLIVGWFRRGEHWMRNENT